WQGCGMACLQMILAARGQKYRLVDLAKQAQDRGVYVRNEKKSLRHNLDGMFHRPFLKFIKQFNLAGKSLRHIGINSLAKLLRDNNFIIASVNPCIREDKPCPTSQQGHLLLLTGFKCESGEIAGFYVHNPSGFVSNKSQENCFVPLEKFKRCFSGNIISINYV
ncbi:C39 family peptidase, partial [Patescibacteria group bacterium]